MKTPYRAVLGTAVEHFWLFNFKIFLVVAALRIKLSEHTVSDVVLKEIEQRLQIENETVVSFWGTGIRVTLLLRVAGICLF